MYDEGNNKLRGLFRPRSSKEVMNCLAQHELTRQRTRLGKTAVDGGVNQDLVANIRGTLNE